MDKHWCLGSWPRLLFCFTSIRTNNCKRYFWDLLVNIIGGDAWYNVTVANDTQYFSEADYYISRLLDGIDFRAKNLESFDSLEKSSVDLYASVRSLYLQDRYRKIKI